MSIKEKILTAISPAKLVKANPLNGKEKVIKKGAPSIQEAYDGIMFAYESTMPLSLIFNENAQRAKDALKVLKAKDVYKKH